MRPPATALERFGPATLHPKAGRASLTRCTSYNDNQREVLGPRRWANHEPRFKNIASERNLNRNSGFVGSNDGIQHLSCKES